MNKHQIFLGITLILCSLFLLGCTEPDLVIPPTATVVTSLATDENVSLFVSGAYDNMFVYVDGNKFAFRDLNVDDINGMANPAVMDLNMDGYAIVDLGYIDFDLNPSVTGQEGRMYWNSDDGTVNIGMPGGNVNLQLGQEMLLQAKNVEGVQIDNGQVVKLSGAGGQKPEVQLTNASEISSDETIAVATEDVANNQFGYFTTSGLVRDFNTVFCSAGDDLYLDTVDGGITNTMPSFPDYQVHVGHCIYSHASEGIILVHIHPEKGDDLANFFNGTFRESFNATADSNGTHVTMSLEKSGGGDLTMQLSDGLTLFDCTPACTIELTAGSDTSPTMNYIYIPQSTKVLTKSTTSFPTSEEHIKVSSFLVPSATHVQSEGTYITHNWNDHLANSNNQGHLAHLAERVRRDGAYYFSGLDPNGTDQAAASSYFDFVAGNEAYLKIASGVIYQMHRHAIPAFDSSTADDDMHVINDSVTPYMEISDFGDITTDSTGASLANKYFNLFFFAVGNKSGEYSPVMVQLPDCGYNTQSGAENDTSGCDNLTMPREFALDSSTGVPIARLTLQYSGGTTTLSHISTTDLRRIGVTASGGGAGATTSFADNQFEVFNVTDATKLLNFDVSTITTGNTRTLSIPDLDGTIALTNIDNAFSVDQTVPDEAYGVAWNGSLEVPTKNAVYDEVELKLDITDASSTYVPYTGATGDVDLGTHNAIANSFRAGYEQTISASEQTITQTGQNTVALTLSGAFNNYVVGSTNPVFNDGTQVGQVIVAKVIDFGFPLNNLTMKDDSANGKVNLQGDKTFTASQEDVLIVMWDGSLWQEVYRNLGYNNEFTGTGSGWGSSNEFSGGNAGWGNNNEFSGGNAGWGTSNVFSGSNSGWGNNNTFSGTHAGWGEGNLFSTTYAGWGQSNKFSGQYSGWGFNNVAKAFQASFGRYSTDQGSTSAWTATDDLFKIGIGTGTGARADAFRLLKNGESHWETDSKHYYGLGDDVSLQFDGSDLIINSENFTANDELNFTNFDEYNFDNNVKVSGPLQATDYYSGDGTQGITDNSSYWFCTASDCSTSCQVDVKDGLIVGCT